jgi:hypothetical protein
VHGLTDGEFQHVTGLRSRGGHGSHEQHRAPALVPRSWPGPREATGRAVAGMVTAASWLEGSSCIS